MANPPIYGRILIVFPALRLGDPLDGRGYVANPPTCGPLLIFFLGPRRWGPSTTAGVM